MMNLRGQKFTVDLSDDEDGSGSELPAYTAPSVSSGFLGDIVERSTPTAAAPPSLKGTSNGYPAHKKRAGVSAFKKQRSGATGSSASATEGETASTPHAKTPPPPTNATTLTQKGPSIEELERRRIDEENTRRVAAMSKEDIEEERQDLLSRLDPSLIERLLKRADLDAGRGDTGIEPPSAPSPIAVTSSTVKAQDAVPVPPSAGKRITASKSVTFADDVEPTEPINLQPASTQPLPPHDPPSVHFPTAPSVPELDPSDPSFLENLHTKYFPNLPADPSKLAWMAPIPTHGSLADQDSPYYPNHQGLPASALRFDFRGGLLPPRIARAMPTTKGLHHHGEAPEAAGYTVPELARLARSAFPAQRCIAYQTLGRLLYRLGRGEWGDAESALATGLWRCVEDGKVLQTLEEAAAAEGGHQGSRAYAVEAVWLWQKGGGKVWKAQ